jgi:hypothetical protein
MMMKDTKIVVAMLAMLMVANNMDSVLAGRREESSGKGKSRRGRRLTVLEEEEWEEVKEACAGYQYDVKLVIDKEHGHLEGFASPTNPEEVTNPLCGSFNSHVVVNQHGGVSKRIEKIESSRGETNYWKTRDSMFLATRSFKDLAEAVDSVDVSASLENAAYKSSWVELNCGTYLMELGWKLKIPVTTEMGTFVASSLQHTSFMKTFTSSTMYQSLSLENWFGRRLGVDPESMVRRLFEYMADQQYPEELVQFD